MKVNRKLSVTSLQGVKIYEGALAVANHRGFKASSLFFLLIKQISKSGTIHDYVNVIEKQTDLKKSKIYSEIKALKKAGLLRIGKNRLELPYIELVSISCFYRFLGFNVTDRFDNNERTINAHVPIYRVAPCKNTKDLEAAIQTVELRRNEQRQEKARKEKFVHSQLIKKLGADYKNQASVTDIRRAKKAALRKLPDAIKNAQPHQLSSAAMPNESVNLEVAISTKRTAELFGYKSAQSGTNIQRHLKKRGLIDVEYRDEVVYQNTNYGIFCSLNLPSNFYFIGKTIRRRLPNKITFH